MKFSLSILTLIIIGIPANGQMIIKSQLKNTEEIDTIIERNNPNSIDLSRHQLFIDTTRTYIYYERMRNWKPLKNTPPTTIDYINELIKDNNPKIFDLKDFPRIWVTLRKFKDDFILYDRCDGGDPAYGFTDSTFNIYGPHEFEARLITKLIKLSEKEIEIESGTFIENNLERKVKLSIHKTEKQDIYILIYETGNSIEKSFITPIEYLRSFDLLVNHCPINKVIEFTDKFDE